VAAVVDPQRQLRQLPAGGTEEGVPPVAGSNVE
jgi:hypothetical protein